MKLNDAIKTSVQEKNLEKINNIALFFRLRGFTHEQTFDIFHELTGIDLPEFDELLYQADKL